MQAQYKLSEHRSTTTSSFRVKYTPVIIVFILVQTKRLQPTQTYYLYKSANTQMHQHPYCKLSRKENTRSFFEVWTKIIEDSQIISKQAYVHSQSRAIDSNFQARISMNKWSLIGSKPTKSKSPWKRIEDIDT